MALTKCKECGHKISKKADKCPECGSPRKSKSSGSGCGTITLVAIIIVVAIAVFSNNDTPSTKTSSKSSATATTSTFETQEEKKSNYIEKLQREIEGFGDFTIDTFLDSKDSIMFGVALFGAWALIAEEGEDFSLNAEEASLLDKFKSEASSAQVKALPKLRDAYGPAARKTLWEHDISARTVGSGFRTIAFVGGAFAANKNIKEFQSSLSETLHQLRFNKSTYKWYKEADEFTYFDLDSPDDTKLIVWLSGGRYREID